MKRIALAGALSLCTILACARQAPPPGGPEDRTSPQVAGVEPASGTSGVGIRQPVRLSFSKSMQRSEVEQSIHFFPPPDSPPRVHWDGHDLVLTPDTAWDSGQTYVLTLAAEATDIRGNRLAGTFQSAFSTGTQIDSGRIVGQVLAQAKPAPGAWVLCYRARDKNPELDSADYVVQADERGLFTLSFLGPGAYRVFGLMDRDRDWLWNIGVEDLAVPSEDLLLDSAGETVFLPALHLTDLDTVLPSLVSCSPRLAGWWELGFDGVWSLAQLDSLEVLLTRDGDSALCDLLIIASGMEGTLLAHSGEVGADSPGEVVIRHARPGRLPEACIPDAVTSPDTLEPFGPIAISPDTGGVWSCAPAQISLWFGEPVDSMAEGAIRLEQGSAAALNAPTDPASVAVHLNAPFELVLSADWDGTGSPQVVVAPGAVVSASGAFWPAEDTVRLTLPILPKDSTGDYEITISGMPDHQAVVRVELWPITFPDRLCQLEVSGQRVGGRLAGGDYLMSLLLDLDGDDRWSPGWPAPFVPAERLWYPADTLRVRPRFTTEFSLNLVP